MKDLSNRGPSYSEDGPSYFAELFRVVRGTGTNLFGFFSYQILGLVYVFLLARFLNTNDLGLYYLGITIINLAGFLSLAGTDTGVRRFVSIYHGANDPSGMRNTLDSAFIIVIPLSVVVGLVLFLSSSVIAASMAKPALSSVLRALSPYLPFFAITSICLAGTHAMKYMQYKVYCQDIGNTTFRIVFLGLFYVLGLRLFGAVLAYVSSIVLVSGMSVYFLTKVFPRVRPERSIVHNFKELLLFSAPQTFSNFIYEITNMTDRLMLGYLTLASSVGIYTVAFRVVASGACILGSFNTMFAPIIADLHHQGESERLESLYKTITKWILTLSLPIYLFLIFFGREVLVIFGSEFSRAYTCLIILCLGQIVNAGTGPSGLIVLMTGHPYITLFNNILTFIMNVGLNLALIPKYGITGAAIATSSSMIFVNVIRVIEVYYFMKIQPYRPNFLKSLFAGFASVGVVLLASKGIITTDGPWSLAVVCITFVVIYGVCLTLLRLDDADRLVLRKVRQLLTMSR